MGASLGTGNRGVSALGASLVKLVLRSYPDADISMLIGQRTAEPFEVVANGKKNIVRVSNFRRSPKASLNEQLLWWVLLAFLYRIFPVKAWRDFLSQRHPLIRVTAEADFVGDIRGGDSFSDIYGLGNFLWGCLPVLAVLLVRRTIALLPQTYGPFRSRHARTLARHILRRAPVIICRDKESLTTVQMLAGADCLPQCCPDVAFCLDSLPPMDPQIEPPLGDLSGRCLIGLNINGLVYNGGYNRANMFGLMLDYPRFLVRLSEALLAYPENHLLLVPHTFAPGKNVESDPAASRDLLRKLPPQLQNRLHIVQGEYDQSEIKGIIGCCDFFIGSRMHACIAALSQNVPTVGIAYSKKFHGVFETVCMEDAVVDMRDCSVEQALQKTLALFERRLSLRPLLDISTRQVQANLNDTFQYLLGNARDHNSRRTVPISSRSSEVIAHKA